MHHRTSCWRGFRVASSGATQPSLDFSGGGSHSSRSWPSAPGRLRMYASVSCSACQCERQVSGVAIGRSGTRSRPIGVARPCHLRPGSGHTLSITVRLRMPPSSATATRSRASDLVRLGCWPRTMRGVGLLGRSPLPHRANSDAASRGLPTFMASRSAQHPSETETARRQSRFRGRVSWAEKMESMPLSEPC